MVVVNKPDVEALVKRAKDAESRARHSEERLKKVDEILERAEGGYEADMGRGR